MGGAGSPALSVLSGMGAGAAMVAVGHPLGRIASCVQASPESYWSCARRAVSVCGFRTLYKAAPFMSSAVSSGICLGAFDIVRTGVQAARPGRLSPGEVGALGAAAGAVSALPLRQAGLASRKALEMGIFFGVANLVRTRCFPEVEIASVPAILAGAAVGGVASEAALLGLKNAERASISALKGGGALKLLCKGVLPGVMRSLPSTFSFVVTATAIQKCLA